MKCQHYRGNTGRHADYLFFPHKLSSQCQFQLQILVNFPADYSSGRSNCASKTLRGRTGSVPPYPLSAQLLHCSSTFEAIRSFVLRLLSQLLKDFRQSQPLLELRAHTRLIYWNLSGKMLRVASLSLLGPSVQSEYTAIYSCSRTTLAPKWFRQPYIDSHQRESRIFITSQNLLAYLLPVSRKYSRCLAMSNSYQSWMACQFCLRSNAE